MEKAKKILHEILKAHNISKRAVYRPTEVCKALNISLRTFHNMAHNYEPSLSNPGEPRNPATINSFTLSTHKRVTHFELVEFIKRNQTHDRLYGPSLD